MRWRTGMLRVILACGLLALSTGSPPVAGDEPPGEGGVWDEILRLYAVAKERGEQVPKDVYAWVRQDLQSHGDWEYRLVEIEARDSKATETKLNELGSERWECIWIQSQGDGMRLFLKRPARSYLRNLPMSQVLKLLPTGDSAGDGN